MQQRMQAFYRRHLSFTSCIKSIMTKNQKNAFNSKFFIAWLLNKEMSFITFLKIWFDLQHNKDKFKITIKRLKHIYRKLILNYRCHKIILSIIQRNFNDYSTNSSIDN